MCETEGAGERGRRRKREESSLVAKGFQSPAPLVALGSPLLPKDEDVNWGVGVLEDSGDEVRPEIGIRGRR